MKCKRLIALLLAVVMLISATGCSMGKHFGTVATVSNSAGDSVEISDGLYLYFVYASICDAADMYSANGKTMTKVKDILAGEINIDENTKKSGADYVKEQIEGYLKDYATSVLMYDDAHLTMTAADWNSVNNMNAMYWGYVQDQLLENGVSEDNYKDVMASVYKENMILQAKYADRTMLTEDEVESVMKSDYLRRNLIKFPITAPEYKALSDADKNKVKALIDEFQKKLEDGVTYEKALDEYMPQILKLTTGETYSSADKYVTDEYVAASGSSYSKEQIDKLKDAKVGEFSYVVDTRYVYFQEKLDVMTRDDKFDSHVAALEDNAKNIAFSAEVQAYSESLKVEYNEEAVKFYDYTKIKYKPYN